MADIVLNTVDLTVFGGPSSLDVSVDVGKQGTRGSMIFAGNGIPSTYLFTQDLSINDIYFNIATSGAYPGWMYQYLLETGSPEWVPILQVVPTIYNAISSQNFGAVTAGTTTISVPMSTFTSSNITDKTKFIVDYSIEKSVPVASAFTYSITGTHPNKYIEVVIKGTSYNGTAWSDLSGLHNVHLNVTYKA